MDLVMSSNHLFLCRPLLLLPSYILISLFLFLILCWLESALWWQLKDILKGMFNILPLKVMFLVSFLLDILYQVKTIPSYFYFSECLTWILNYVKWFFCFYWDHRIIFLLYSLIWMNNTLNFLTDYWANSLVKVYPYWSYLFYLNFLFNWFLSISL